MVTELRPYVTVCNEARDRFIADFRKYNLDIETDDDRKARKVGNGAVHGGNCVVDMRIPMEYGECLDNSQFYKLYGCIPGLISKFKPYEEVLWIIDMHGTVQFDQYVVKKAEAQTFLKDIKIFIQGFHRLFKEGRQEGALDEGGDLFDKKQGIEEQF